MRRGFFLQSASAWRVATAKFFYLSLTHRCNGIVSLVILNAVKYPIEKIEGFFVAMLLKMTRTTISDKRA